MKFLLDTNVLIPLEPANDGTIEGLATEAARLHSLAVRLGHQVFIHPATHRDIGRDKLQWRNELRRRQFSKYALLTDPPSPPERYASDIGNPAPGTNEWVDNQLLAAVLGNAVDYLVTEDQGLFRKARRIGVAERVARVSEALDLLSDLSDTAPPPPPTVRSVPAYALDPSDPIFESFRGDYPGFDGWLQKCQRQHRQSWTITAPSGKLAGLVIVNPEDKPEPPMSGRVLKICTMKVAEEAHGFRFGELLLKVVFDYCAKNRYEWLYVTAFEKHPHLIQLFEDFGFRVAEKRTGLGELIFIKRLSPPRFTGPEPSALEYHVLYGPPALRSEGVPWYIVPILPRFAEILFPETEHQERILETPRPYGNAIRKAYLCHAQVKDIEPGSLLFFYRSETDQALITVGVAEAAVRSTAPDEIARAVGKRTVYSFDQIREMCRKPVLAILFRQAQIFRSPVPTAELLAGRVISAPPQSISKIGAQGREWLRNRLQL